MFDPVTLSQAGTGLQVFGRVFGALADLDAGSQARRAAEFRAAQLRVNAGQAMAASQRDAYTAEQQAKRVASRALAVAAASGGGASDPTVVNLISGIAAEGAYRQAVALYQGQEQARAMENQARATEYEGKLAKQAGVRNAIGGFIGAGATAVAGEARTRDMIARTRPGTAPTAGSGITGGQSLFQKYGLGGPKLTPASPYWDF